MRFRMEEARPRARGDYEDDPPVRSVAMTANLVQLPSVAAKGNSQGQSDPLLGGGIECECPKTISRSHHLAVQRSSID
jgi:hypothetical protein